jgi:TP901-1 family phage major tail protein
MTAQKGKDLLLKVDSDGEGDFTTVAGLRARTLAFNAGRSTLASYPQSRLLGFRWPADA